MKTCNTTTKTTNVGVFCSASNSADSSFKRLAFSLGKFLAVEEYGLITGGTQNGLIKSLIDGYAEYTKELQPYGVLPRSFEHNFLLHPAIIEKNLTRTDNMHQRIATFHNKCDVIIVMPGGYGTLHELMDFVVHNQFGFLNKKIILWNIDNFWNHLLKQFAHMVARNFLFQQDIEKIIPVVSIKECIQQVRISKIQEL